MAKKIVKEKVKKDPQQVIKTVMNAVLITFIIVSIGYAAYKGFGGGKKAVEVNAVPAQITDSAQPAAPVQRPAAEKGKIILYYLHSTGRCSNCILMEQYSKEAVEMYFSKQTKSGELEFRVLNTDDPENRHFMQDYQLVTKSLVITLVKDGKEQKYENLKGIWDNIRNQEAFHKYVKDNVEKYLQEAK